MGRNIPNYYIQIDDDLSYMRLRSSTLLMGREWSLDGCDEVFVPWGLVCSARFRCTRLNLRGMQFELDIPLGFGTAQCELQLLEGGNSMQLVMTFKGVSTTMIYNRIPDTCFPHGSCSAVNPAASLPSSERRSKRKLSSSSLK